MKKAIVLAAMGLALVSAAGCSGSKEENKLETIKEKGVLVMATSPDFAPYEFQDVSSGETKYLGAEIELGKYIAEQMGVELQLEAMDFSAGGHQHWKSGYCHFRLREDSGEGRKHGSFQLLQGREL